MRTKIYALRDGHWIRYVGKTVFSLDARLSGHLADVRNGSRTHKSNWIRSLLSDGKLPRITLIEEVEGNGCKEERYWIKYFRDHTVDLVNSTDGGEGEAGWHHSEDVCHKLSAMGMGHDVPVKVRQKISNSLKGHVSSIQNRLAVSKAHKGIPKSEEHRKKIGLGNKGKIRTPEMRRRYSLASKRRPPRTLEQRAAISKRLSEEYASGKRVAWNKGQHTPDGVKKKISLSMTGTKRSDMFKNKMRTIAKAGQYGKHFK